MGLPLTWASVDNVSALPSSSCPRLLVYWLHWARSEPYLHALVHPTDLSSLAPLPVVVPRDPRRSVGLRTCVLNRHALGPDSSRLLARCARWRWIGNAIDAFLLHGNPEEVSLGRSLAKESLRRLSIRTLIAVSQRSDYGPQRLAGPLHALLGPHELPLARSPLVTLEQLPRPVDGPVPQPTRT